ncbi:MAG: PD40 domain-containing protein [Planctomycetes bacterium]|nr:PD40 domain-containing protein [Planctomycetota bacterium]
MQNRVRILTKSSLAVGVLSLLGACAASTRTQAPTSTPDAPATQAADAARPGFSSSPRYAAFGEAPATAAANSSAPLSDEQTENISRVSMTDVGADFDPCVSPDGERVYFASTRHRPTSDIYVKRTDSSAVTLLTSDAAHDVMPAISPDGKRLAFASNRNGSYDIYVMNAAGGQAVQVTADPGQELRPTWSPDGKTLAFCRVGERSDRWEVWSVDTTRAGSLKFLTYGMFPAWQPKGDKIAFQRSRERGDRFYSIWTIDYANGEARNPTEVVASATTACINPSWSPDGSLIAFSTVTNPAAIDPASATPVKTGADVWIVAADGSARAALTAGTSANLSPVWGPMNRVFFVSNRSGAENLWSIGAEQAVAAISAGTPSTMTAQAPHANPEQPVDVAPQMTDAPVEEHQMTEGAESPAAEEPH